MSAVNPLGQSARDPGFIVCSLSAHLATRALDLTRTPIDEATNNPRAMGTPETFLRKGLGGACLGLVALASLVEACFRLALALFCIPISCFLSREHAIAKATLTTVSILGETASMTSAKVSGKAFLHNLFGENIPDFDAIAANLGGTPWPETVRVWGGLIA